MSKSIRTIPGYSRYKVSKNGIVYNKVTGKFLEGSTNPAGYHLFRLSDDFGKIKTIGRCRILLKTFKPIEYICPKTVVNHINGIKSDDRLSNLEWTTYKGNVEHAGATGLSPKCLPVSTKDITSNKVLHFPSIIEMARHFNVTKDFINYRVHIGDTRIFPELRQYKFTDDEPWYIPSDLNKELLKNSANHEVSVRNLQDNNVVDFESLTEASRYLGIAVSTLSVWLQSELQEVRPGLVQVQRKDNLKPWIDVEDPWLELIRSYKLTPVVQLNRNYDLLNIFESIANCSRFTNVGETTLSARLKSKASKVYSDECRYCYYEDYINMVPLDSDVKMELL